MVFRTLGARAQFLPRGMIVVRGGEVLHGIEPFQGGQRVSLTHFSHDSVWKHFGVSFHWSTPLQDSLARIEHIKEENARLDAERQEASKKRKGVHGGALAKKRSRPDHLSTT
jgi:hypothetical protein